MNFDSLKDALEGMPKHPIDWLGMAMDSVKVAFELQLVTHKVGAWSNYLRTRHCDPVQHMNSLLDAWDCLADSHIQSCTVALACGCAIANMWDEWAFDPCDEHIKALDGRDPVQFWIHETEEGQSHVTDPETMNVQFHEAYIHPDGEELEKIMRKQTYYKGGRQQVHMRRDYKNKHDGLIAERLIRSVSNDVD